MSKETIGECGCCGFEGVLVKSYPRRQGETILLCKLCAGTFISNHTVHAGCKTSNDDLAKAIAFIGNAILAEIKKGSE